MRKLLLLTTIFAFLVGLTSASVAMIHLITKWAITLPAIGLERTITTQGAFIVFSFQVHFDLVANYLS